MLTLDQVRSVNDGFKSGDLNAALRPLEETVDLRVNELPRLDKTALTALKSGLQNGEDAATWAEALFHPNISVRRFARKTFMGLGDESAPLFVPLRDRLERYWSEVKPLPETNKSREAALRREQREMVESALELLLRAHPEEYLTFYANVMDSAPHKSSNTQAVQEWSDRNRKAWEVTQKETDRLLEQEWGKEWLASDKRWKLPSRVLRELDQRARQTPEVARLWTELGDNPYQHVALEWEPLAMMSGAMMTYLSDYNATGPTRRVAERLRPLFWRWLETAFDASHPLDVRHKNGRRLLNEHGWGVSTNWLGSERLQKEVPALLLQAKESLLGLIKKLVAGNEAVVSLDSVDAEVLLVKVWVSLAWGLGRELRPSYGVKLEDWPIPEGVSPETIREIIKGLQFSKANSYFLNDLKTGADNIEKARQAQSEAAQAELVLEAEPVSTDLLDESTLLSAQDVLSNERLQEIRQAAGDYEKSNAQIQAEVRRIEGEMASIQNPDEKIRLLVQPPPHPRDPNKIIYRMPYWKVWARDLGENGAQKLKDALWSRTEPMLWARLEEHLEDYRRAETDPIEPRIEQKLTEREIKEWRTQTRRDKRNAIALDIRDIANLLMENEGLSARLKVIDLADRPSCRDIRDQFEAGLFAEIERFPGEYNYNLPPAKNEDWEGWRLNEDWDATLSKMETRLGESKLNDWQQAILRRQLATGFYRRGNFDKFEHYAGTPNAFPRAVATAVVPYNDFEAWRVLLVGANQWGNGPLTKFWKLQREDDALKERATRTVIELVSTTSDEGVAKSLLAWLDEVPAEEMAVFVEIWERALESSLPVVRRRAMTVLGALKDADFDRESAAQLVGESLWSENASLAKDAAKFLSQLGVADAEVTGTAWELLSDATALDNMAVCEVIYRALSQIKTKHKTLVLPDAAREKLDDLVAVHSERFAKFQKKLT